jgi:hypothetical protein
MPPVVALLWSLAGITAAFTLRRSIDILGYCLISMLALHLETSSCRAYKRALRFTAPFALPLAIVHGVINPAFAISTHYYFLPLRLNGFLYAAEVILRVLLLTLVAISWSEVDPDALLHDSVRVRLPLPLIVSIAVTASTVKIIGRKIEAVHLAQQARGVRTGPGLLIKASALIALVIPVALSTLIDNSARGEILSTRGLGTGRLALRPRESRLEPKDLSLALLPTLSLLFFWTH